MTENNRKIEIIIANHYKLIDEPKRIDQQLLDKDIITLKGKKYLLQDSFYEVSFSSEEGIGIEEIVDSKSFPKDKIKNLMIYLIKFQGIRDFSKLSFPMKYWTDDSDSDLNGSAVQFQGLSQAEYTLFSDYFEQINSGYIPSRKRQAPLPFE